MLGSRLSLLLFALLLQGCALQSYLAGQVDLLIEMRMQANLDLYYQQKKKLGPDIDRWLNQQKTYLPEVKEFVVGIDPKSQDIKLVMETFNLYYQRSAHEFNQLFCRYLAQLDVPQQKHFFDHQIEDNKELENQISKMNLELLEERVSFFMGEITASQRPLLKSYLPHWIERSKLRLARRLELQAKLKEIFTLPAADREGALNQAFQTYVETSFQNMAPVETFLKQLKATLTPDQIEQLLKRKKQLLELLDSFSQSSF